MSTSGDQSQSGPPYVPSTASLGGVPSITPDVPITVIFLFLYIIFAIVHIRILKKNKAQGHKFIFNGAIFGFCKIRIITMSLRIAWACHSTNISLGIAAQTFVYVGTIILYIVNWFFTQRVVRAQHQRFGWSLPYRIIHRLGLVFLVLSLFLLIVGSIQQHFTLDADTLNIDRALQLTGQTYFAAFSFAPMVLVALSLLIPRQRVEKFGAGRLRINISVLLIATAILSAGQIFRCVTSWVPPAPIRDAQGLPAHVPWYYSKGCFYVFNFTTEILVVIFYAIVRADLRFHIPDGAKRAGDYSRIRDSMFNINIIGQEKNLKRHSGRMGSISSVRSNETIQEYEGSLFEDSRTLADSLRHPSSVLEIDPKNGHWKIKRMSQRTSLSSFQHSNHSSSSLWDPTRNTLTNNPPPVPAVPTDWPLRESQIHRGQVPVMEHPHRTSQSSCPSSKHGVSYAAPYGTPDMEKDDALAEAIRKLEANSETNKQPPNYQNPTTVDRVHDSLAPRNGHQPGSDIPRKHVYVPNTRVADSPLKHDYRASFAGQSSDLPKKHDYSASPAPAPAPTAGSDIPTKHNYNALSANPVGSDLPQKRVSSVPYASTGSDLPQKRDYSAPYAPAAWDPPQKQDYNATFGTAPGSDIPKKVVYAPPERTATPPQTSHSYTRGSTSIDTEAAEREFERFSFEASPREGSFNESEQSERDLERRYTQDGRPYRDV